MDLNLTGRHVLITGASKGIGRACAELFAREGGALDLVARSRTDLERAANELHETYAATVVVHTVDLSRAEGPQVLAASLEAVDIVVNNAGAIPGGDLQGVDDETLRQAWDLKLFGYINLCRLLLPRLESQGYGVIVNVIGGAGQRPQPNYIAGGMGNAALMALTQALGSRSLRKGVRVVGVNPGLIVTDRLTALLRTQAADRWGDPERWPELIPTDPPPGEPSQVADLVAFLSSERGSHISGTVVTIDGGHASR
jgi:NAD(P)-dependent dehydrogenase (short-subunit alcohol dehydrogenase family)